MGNCLTCFRSPSPMVNNSHTNTNIKEDMSEVRLYAAPSHTLPLESSNGNKACVSVGVSTGAGGGVSECGAGACQATPTAASAPPPQVDRDVSPPSISDGHTRTHVHAHLHADARLIALFETYRDASEDTILAEGIEHLCNDLQVSPDEFRVLILAWKLDASQMCRFTRSEWLNGLRSMRVDSIKGIQQRLPELITELTADGELFKDLYRFTFRFGLDTNSGQRALPSDMAACLWKLVFSIREPPILERWLSFLEAHHSQVRAIPRDTWNMFLNFAEAVGNDLSSYDDTEAWPSLFDDFVEYENDQANQNVTKAKETDTLLIRHEN